MLTKSQEILRKLELAEGVPDYAAGSGDKLQATDGLTALEFSQTPTAELEESELASATLDTGTADIGVESASFTYATYLRAQGLTTPPEWDADVRACGMTREALRAYTITQDLDGTGDWPGAGRFVHGETAVFGAGTGTAISGITNADPVQLTVTLHGVPVGSVITGIIRGVTFGAGEIPEIEDTLDGGWTTITAVDANTLSVGGVDASSATGVVDPNARIYLPPVISSVTTAPGAVTTLTLTSALCEDYLGEVGSQCWIDVDGIAGFTPPNDPNGLHLATVTAVSGTGATLTIEVNTTGDTLTGTETVTLLPRAKVVGDKSVDVADNQKLVVYTEQGEGPADAVIGGVSSKATASVHATTPTAAGGYRYRPISERTFQMTTSAWTSTAPNVGDIITRVNKCGAYGRVVDISTNGQTITYEPYGEAFVANDTVRRAGLSDTATVSTVTTTGDPSLTLEARYNGVIYTYVGARGTFTIEYEVGKPIKIRFTFEGLKYKDPVDSILAGVTQTDVGKVRFLQGFHKARDLTGLKACDFSYEISNAQIALNRTPTQKPDATKASGVLAYRHQEEYVPQVTMDPAMTPVGVHAFYAIAAGGSTVSQIFGVGAGADGYRVLTYLPAVQYEVSPFGDRDGERTIDLTGSCRRVDGDDAVQLFVY